MFSTYQSIIALLCEQMQTLPAPPVEQSDYKVWTCKFMKTVVHHLLIYQSCWVIGTQVGFNCISKGEWNPLVEEMVDEAAAVLEVVADDLWITWGMQVIPNIVR